MKGVRGQTRSREVYVISESGTESRRGEDCCIRGIYTGTVRRKESPERVYGGLVIPEGIIELEFNVRTINRK